MPPVKRIIITGANGFVGTSVLRQALSHPHIQKVFAIVRKSLPSDVATHPKLHEIVLVDFEHWPQDILTQLREEGVLGCIW